MTQLRIHLLGQISIQHGCNPITELSAKAQEMFCYLMLYRDRPHTRATLAAALWSDTSTQRAQKYLRQTLWQLQTVLEILARCAPGCEARVFGSRYSGKAKPYSDLDLALVGAGELSISGDPGRLQTLLSFLDAPDPDFEIVLP